MAPSRGPQPIPRTIHVTLNAHKGPVNVVRYSKGSAQYVLTGGQDRTIRLWNANLGNEIKAFAAHGYEVLSITVYVYCSILSSSGCLISYPPSTGLMTTPSSRHQEEIDLFFSGM